MGFRFLLVAVLMVVFSATQAQNRFWVATSAANWSGDNWSGSSGGAPDGAGPPADAATARFDANGNGNCTLDLAIDSVSGFIMNGYTGVLDLNGNILANSGNQTLTTGSINDGVGTGIFRVNGTGSINFNGTTFGAAVVVNTSNITLSGSTFNSSADFTKIAGGNNTGTGGNVFNGPVSIINQDNSSFTFGNVSPDDFNSTVILDNQGTGRIQMAHNSTGNTFDGNITITNTGGGIFFGNAGGTSVLGTGIMLTLGAGGFTTGTLQLANVSQASATAQTLVLTGTTTTLNISGSSFGGNIAFTAPRFTTTNTNYLGTASLTKTGTGNNQSTGGNVFTGNAIITHSGDNQLEMARTLPDTFNADLTVNNNTSGGANIILATNSAGSLVGGNLTINNQGAGNTSNLTISNSAGSSFTVSGNVIVNNVASANSSVLILGNSGNIQVNGNLTVVNNGTGGTSEFNIAYQGTGSAGINGVSRVSNLGSTNNSRVYLGRSGSVTFQDSLYCFNNSSANNSQFYLNHGGGSNNVYNGSILIENPNANADGILFGNSSGAGTIAAGQTIAIGPNGFQGSGNLYLRNLTQLGAIPMTLLATGTVFTTVIDCDFGGNVSFTSPRIRTSGTTYNGTSLLQKTGANDDQSNGGNIFQGDCQLVNTGTGYILMGNISPDTWNANLSTQNSGSRHIYVAYNTAGNTLAGNLNVTNNGTGTSYTYISGTNPASFAIGGDVTITNNGSGTDTRVLLGDRGDVTIQGTVDIFNTGSSSTNIVLVANSDSSNVIINDSVVAENSATGTTSQLYFGNSGDVAFGGHLSIRSTSGVTNSQVFLNRRANSVNTYAGNIEMEQTNATGDGFSFGIDNGRGTLAAGQTISIGAGGYVSGELRIRNFTQVGATAQDLQPTGTTNFIVYDCAWGGNVVFRGPRFTTRGTTYSGTATLEKTGASDDDSVGGNIFDGVTSLTNSGTGRMQFANSVQDTFRTNLTILNSGTNSFILGGSSAGNYVGGNVDATQSTSGGGNNLTLANSASSTLVIDGNLSFSNLSSASDSRIYVGNQGDITINGTSQLLNNSTGANGRLYIANNVNSQAILQGNVTVTNNGTGSNTHETFLGAAGDVTFNGNVSITNNATANNSFVFINHNATSTNTFNGNIVLEATDVNCDGVFFGRDGGSATLAATRTITIGGAGFIGINLYLRNFTQVGPTAQTLEPTVSTFTTIYDCDWGGDIVFTSPRISTRGTLYRGTLNLTKNGANNDQSLGGNYVTGNCQLVCSGSGYLLMGNSVADTFNLNLDISNTGSNHFYLAHNSAGNFVGGTLTAFHAPSGTINREMYMATSTSSSLRIVGDAVLTSAGSNTANSNLVFGNSGDIVLDGSLTATCNPSAGNGFITVASGATSSVTIGGSVLGNNNGNAANSSSIRIGNSGDVTIGSNLTLNNPSNANISSIRVAEGADSEVIISGNTVITNTGNGATRTRAFLGNSGDVTFQGNLNITNSSPSNESEVFLHRNVASVNAYNGNIVLECTNASCDGFQFGSSLGSGTLAATRTITIGGGGFIAGQLLLRNFTQVGPTNQVLQPTGTASSSLIDTDWGGNLIFTSPRMLTRGSNYRGTLTIGKTGANTDNSAGGNTVAGNCVITNSGSGEFYWATDSADTFRVNVIVNNTGTSSTFLANNSPGNYIGGDFTVNNISSGTNSNFRFALNGNATAVVEGATNVTNTSSATSASITLGGNGSATFNSTVLVLHSPSGTNGTFSMASGGTSVVTVNQNLTVTASGIGGSDKRVYLADAGTLILNADLALTQTSSSNSSNVYVADDGISSVTVAGTTTVVNGGNATTARIYLGNSGDVTFNGLLNIRNSSGANNSQIYVHQNASSTGIFQQNIVLEVTNPNSDGILFGNNAGNGTLAATRTISIGGSGYIAGNLYLRNFTQIGPTAQILQPTGTTDMRLINSNWGGNVIFHSPRFRTSTSTFNGTANLEKTGASDDNSDGGNTFIGNTRLANSGSGYLLMGNIAADEFQANLQMLLSGSDHLYLAHNTAGNTVAGTLDISNTSTSGNANVYLASRTGSELTVTGNTTMTNSASGSSNHILIGDRGAVTFSGDVSYFGTGTSTNNDLYFSSEGSGVVGVVGDLSVVNAGTATNNQIAYLPRRGTLTVGGKMTVINNTNASNGQALLANDASSSLTVGDTLEIRNGGNSGNRTQTYVGNQGDVVLNGPLLMFNTSGSPNSHIYLQNGTSSSVQYNGNIEMEVTNANSDGILFGNGGGSGTLAAGRTITIGSLGFIAGRLDIRNFTQVGATAQVLQPTGSTFFNIQVANWGGDVTFSGPRFQTRFSTYNGTSQLEKTGGIGDDQSVGGNTFVGNCTLINSGTRYLLMGNSSVDEWQANVLMQNTGSSLLYIAANNAGHTIDGNLTVENSGSGTTNQSYVSNGNSAGIAIGGNVLLTNTSSATNSRIFFGNSGDVTVTGNVSGTNNPNGSNTGEILLANGGNSLVTINGTTTLVNSGTGNNIRHYIGNQGDVVFNGDLGISNSSGANNNQMYFHHSGNSDNTYNGNIVMEVDNAASDGIQFGRNGGEGVVTTGNTMSIGANGFVAGEFYLRNITQQGGATTHNLPVTGTTSTTVYSVTFDGTLNISTPRFFIRNSTFNGNSSFTKTSGSNDNSRGGNVFNGDVTFGVTGTGYMLLANNESDDHNGNVTYIRSNTGQLYPSYNRTCTYAGDINFNTASQVELGRNNGRVVMDGSGPQSINDLGASVEPLFRRITLNNTADEVTLNMPITIRTNITFTAGNMVTTLANILTMNDNSGATGGSNDSHVDGPMEKVGNDNFTFPLGDSASYHPLSITGPSGNTSRFRAEYFEADPGVSFDPTSRDGSLTRVSEVEYWQLDRTFGSSSVRVTLAWDTASAVTNLADLAVARWDSGLMRWIDHGNGGTTGDTASGTIQTNGTVTTFSPFTLASTSNLDNPLPIELLSFEARPNGQQVDLTWITATEINNDFFTIERSSNGLDFEPIEMIDGAGNSNKVLHYNTVDLQPLSGTSYYRLKQTDFNGTYAYSDIVLVRFDDENAANEWYVYPNPGDGSELYVRLEGQQVMQHLEVRDLTGRIWHQQVLQGQSGVQNQLILDQTLPSGIYLITLISDTAQETKRVIVQ